MIRGSASGESRSPLPQFNNGDPFLIGDDLATPELPKSLSFGIRPASAARLRVVT